MNMVKDIIVSLTVTDIYRIKCGLPVYLALASMLTVLLGTNTIARRSNMAEIDDYSVEVLKKFKVVELKAKLQEVGLTTSGKFVNY